jgi:hypothetical protein
MKKIKIVALSLILMLGTSYIMIAIPGQGISACIYSCTVSSDSELNLKKCTPRDDLKGDTCGWTTAGASCSSESSTGCHTSGGGGN